MGPAWSGVVAALLFGAGALGAALGSDASPVVVATVGLGAAAGGALLSSSRATPWGPAALGAWILLGAVTLRLLSGEGALAGTWLGASVAGAGLLASLAARGAPRVVPDHRPGPTRASGD